MSETDHDPKQEAQTETRTGREMTVEVWIERHLGNSIHLFLSLLSGLIFIAALIAAYDTVISDFPKLWNPGNEYQVLQGILENILLIAIAAELGLLLLFHRTSAAVEVIIFVIARKMVSPETTVNGLLLGTLAIIALVVTRFYFIPGRPK
ncbi:MAG TPA: hypothetical protein VJ302_29470 [Blastocatellia bacterium]|nr:hypothetical protein [Blastocatellia bacterium]